MSLEVLATRLNKLYRIMSVNRETSNICFLFALLYADDIKDRISVPTLIQAAGLKKSYRTELYKGLKLVPYINLKPENEAELRAKLEG